MKVVGNIFVPLLHRYGDWVIGIYIYLQKHYIDIQRIPHQNFYTSYNNYNFLLVINPTRVEMYECKKKKKLFKISDSDDGVENE